MILTIVSIQCQYPVLSPKINWNNDVNKIGVLSAYEGSASDENSMIVPFYAPFIDICYISAVLVLHQWLVLCRNRLYNGFIMH